MKKSIFLPNHCTVYKIHNPQNGLRMKFPSFLFLKVNNRQSVDIYLLKVTCRNSWKMYEICSKLTRQTLK